MPELPIDETGTSERPSRMNPEEWARDLCARHGMNPTPEVIASIVEHLNEGHGEPATPIVPVSLPYPDDGKPQDDEADGPVVAPV